jgi:hypothetical protein
MILGLISLVDVLVFYGIPMSISVKKIMVFGILKVALGF